MYITKEKKLYIEEWPIFIKEISLFDKWIQSSIEKLYEEKFHDTNFIIFLFEYLIKKLN